MKKDYDVIIVLGGGVDQQGNVPSWVERRLDRAVELYQQKRTRIITCGRGVKGKALLITIPEATEMKNGLVARGIPQADVFEEPFSRNTFQNAFFSRVLHVDMFGWKQLLVITNRFHSTRAGWLFQWVFGEGYSIFMETVPDDGLDAEVLKKRRVYEEALQNYCLYSLFPRISSGDLIGMHQLVFDPEHPLIQEEDQLSKNLNQSLALY